MSSTKCEVFYAQHGRGVRAIKEISKGSVICRNHCIRLPTKKISNEISFYVFESEKDGVNVLALGLATLINHDKKKTNCSWDYCPQTNRLTIIASKNIPAGQEIFHDYGWGDKFIADLSKRQPAYESRKS